MSTPEKTLPTSPPPPEIKEPLTEEGELEKEINKINNILFVVILVILVALGAMFATVGSLVWNAHTFSASIYQNLVNEIDEINDKIDILSQEISNLEIQQKTPETTIGH